MQVVHVIPNPELGDRHEEHFPDSWTPAQILKRLTRPSGTMPALQDPYGAIRVSDDPDAEQVAYLDHPETRVVIGRSIKAEEAAAKGLIPNKKPLPVGKIFEEIKTIHGPEAK